MAYGMQADVYVFDIDEEKLKTLKIDVDFSKLSIKGKTAVGNIVTKSPVKSVDLKSKGLSTLSARKIWFDDNVQRLNVDSRGEFLGDFKAEDKILVVSQKGFIELKSFDISNHFDDDVIVIASFSSSPPNSDIVGFFTDVRPRCNGHLPDAKKNRNNIFRISDYLQITKLSSHY